jgi:nucleoside-diphosphate-sugar epimerase
MTVKRIFITGASGCIGHYITDELIRETQHELFLLVRNPDKLKLDCTRRSGITVLQGDLNAIGDVRDTLDAIDCAILTAAAWGGTQECWDINVTKTHELIDLLNPEVCQQVLYFSTASLLDRHNCLLPEAGQIGTDYIRSKYDCLQTLPRLALSDRMTVLYPTLVLGGDEQMPYSHISGGLPDVMKWINAIRFFKVDGSFHFMHAADIARVVRHFVEHPPHALQHHVLGNEPYTVDRAIREICAYLDRRIYFRVPLSGWLVDFFIKVFNIQMADWDRFCLSYRHFVYDRTISPAALGLPAHCPTMVDVLKTRNILPRR